MLNASRTVVTRCALPSRVQRFSSIRTGHKMSPFASHLPIRGYALGRHRVQGRGLHSRMEGLCMACCRSCCKHICKHAGTGPDNTRQKRYAQCRVLPPRVFSWCWLSLYPSESVVVSVPGQTWWLDESYTCSVNGPGCMDLNSYSLNFI